MATPRLSLSATPRKKYGENDELEVEVAVDGRGLSGSISVFDAPGQLDTLQKSLLGFPSHIGDEVSFELGIFNRLTLRLSTHGNGRVRVSARLEVYAGYPNDTYEEVLEVQFDCDPSAIDVFCRSLQVFTPGVLGSAELAGRV